MEHVFSIMMFIVAGAFLLYAGVLALTRDVQMIPKSEKAKIEDKKGYALRFAGVMASLTIGLLAGGIVGWFAPVLPYAVIALVVGLALGIFLSVLLMKDAK